MWEILMLFIPAIDNRRSIIQDLPGSYQQRTVINEPIFLGIYEIPRSYILSNIGLYFDENEFYIPEKLLIELCLV